MDSYRPRHYAALLIFFLTISFNTACKNTTSSEQKSAKPPIPLPQVIINTKGLNIVDEPKTDAHMLVLENNEPTYDGNIGIEFRGAFSQTFPKKSYGLETRDSENEDLDVSLLGFPEEEDWVLHGPYADKSLVRNKLIYDLSRDIGRYASRSEFVELTLNNEHQGIYVFMEKMKRDKNRIPLNKLKDDENTGEDVTGGYLLKIDKLAGNNLGEGYNDQNSFTSTFLPKHSAPDREIHFLYEYPKAEDITPAQKQYISTYLNDFETALASENFTDKQLGYEAYIDVPSFIDFFLLNELSNNVDAYRLSTFLQKDKNEKLQMGPIWDFNLAFGNVNVCNNQATDNWAYRFNERCPSFRRQVPFWWERLLQSPDFVSQLKTRWTTLRTNEFKETTILSKIDSYTETLEQTGALENNFTIWDIIGTPISYNFFVGGTYEEDTQYLKNWISDRLAWMDEAIEQL